MASHYELPKDLIPVVEQFKLHEMGFEYKDRYGNKARFECCDYVLDIHPGGEQRVWVNKQKLSDTKRHQLQFFKTPQELFSILSEFGLESANEYLRSAKLDKFLNHI